MAAITAMAASDERLNFIAVRCCTARDTLAAGRWRRRAARRYTEPMPAIYGRVVNNAAGACSSWRLGTSVIGEGDGAGLAGVVGRVPLPAGYQTVRDSSEGPPISPEALRWRRAARSARKDLGTAGYGCCVRRLASRGLHINEGTCAFLILELRREAMDRGM